MRRTECWLMVTLLTAVALPLVSHAAESSQIDFARDVLPVLKARCLECHDGRKQRGGLRLDQRAAALRGGESYGPAIHAGKSAESPLILMVTKGVDGLVMPPEGERLSPAEVRILRNWIDAGAEWPDAENQEKNVTHWSFGPLQRPVVPVIDAADPAGNPIDAFITARLAAKGLSRSSVADRAILQRRLSFGLRGLPPTPEEVDAFLADSSPEAYERLVDRWLAAPQFGERWARHWLDVVRFAESNGFEMNQTRPNAWPYRDYVIRAFNDDLPYNRFVTEQLAGDQLGRDEATGFLVGGSWDQVKSPDLGLTLQQRADELHDMVSTTGSAFLGLTVGCARCHNHKFDPITQVDYHAIKAALSGVQHGERPQTSRDGPARSERLQQATAELQRLEIEIGALVPPASLAPIVWLDDDTPTKADADAPRVHQLRPRNGLEPHYDGDGRGERRDPGDLSRLPNLGRNYSHWNRVAGQNLFAWEPRVSGPFRIWVSWGSGFETHATDARYVLDQDGNPETRDDQRELARIDQRKFADGSDQIPGRPLWSGFRDLGVHDLKPMTRLLLRGGDTEAYVTADLVVFQGADIAGEQPAVRSPVRSGEANIDRFLTVAARFVRFTVLSTTSPSEPCLDELEVFAAGSSKNVALSQHGAQATSSGNFADPSLHRLEKVNDGQYGNGSSWISSEIGHGWVQIEFPAEIEIDRVAWSRDRDGLAPHYADRTPMDYRIEVSRDGASWTTVATGADRVPLGWKMPPVRVVSVPAGQSRAAIEEQGAKHERLRSEITALSVVPVVYAGRMIEPEPIKRLHRGDPLQPREPIAPGGLAAFGDTWQLPEDSPDAARRIALAKWITDPAHPLTARVIVNRLWQQHFGRGLVPTPSDFGRNGAAPTHPELLDWLAVELIERGWSLKAIHRLIVTSATYQQASAAHDRGLEFDAGTQFLWRYPPRRLEAEPLRDTILSISGNLEDRMGGPGFDLFEPNTNYVKVYQSKRQFGPAEWRRMVYQSKPRMQLDDTFGVFDCPDAGQIAPQRTISTTALQALNLLNSGFLQQQADLFAERLIRDAGPTPAAQVRRAFRLAFSRDPDADELAAAVDLIAEHGLAAFCRAVLNANELLYVF